MPPLKAGQHVKVRVNKMWVNGVIIAIVGIRSYSVRIDNSTCITRNRRHLIIDGDDASLTVQNSSLNYDDITTRTPPPPSVANIPSEINNNVQDNIAQPQQYVSRFGRVVRPPERWGYSNST